VRTPVVAAEEIDRADVGGVFAPDQRPAVAEDAAAVGQQLLEVPLDPVLDQPGVDAKVVGGVVEDLLDLDGHGLAGAVGDPPGAGLLDQCARGRHPVERLGGPAVGVDQHRAVRLDQQQPRRQGQVGAEPARVVDTAAGDHKAHGPDRTAKPRPPGRSRVGREVVNRTQLPGTSMGGNERTEGELGATLDGSRPPGPRGNLFLGSIAEIRRDNVLAFLDAWRRYGDTVRFRGPLTLYLLAHPDAVKHVLQDNAANYPRPPFVRDRLQAIVGGGLVGAEGPDWVRSRRMAQPAFRRHSLEGYGRQFVEAPAEALDSWAADAD